LGEVEERDCAIAGVIGLRRWDAIRDRLLSQLYHWAQRLKEGARGVRPYGRTHFSMMKVYQKKSAIAVWFRLRRDGAIALLMNFQLQ
jgi:hypothetical protein